MENNTLLELALQCCVDCHKGQLYRNGDPYWVHPVRVFTSMYRDGYGAKFLAAALMHDAKEENPRLYTGIYEPILLAEVARAVDLLTIKDDDDYISDYIHRVIESEDEVAMMVKLYDIKDKLNFEVIDEKASRKLPLYYDAYTMIKRNLLED